MQCCKNIRGLIYVQVFALPPQKKDLKQELISGQGSITGGMVILF